MLGPVMMMMSPMVGRIVGVLVLVLALVAGGFYLRHSGYQEGYRQAAAVGAAEMASYKESQAKVIAEITAQNRAIEERLVTRILQDQMEKELEIQAINDHHRRILFSLRQRPARDPPQPTPSESPVPAAPQCPRTGSTGAELSREDGEFLIGEAAGADILRHALMSCRRAYERILTEPKEK